MFVAEYACQTCESLVKNMENKTFDAKAYMRALYPWPSLGLPPRRPGSRNGELREKLWSRPASALTVSRQLSGEEASAEQDRPSYVGSSRLQPVQAVSRLQSFFTVFDSPGFVWCPQLPVSYRAPIAKVRCRAAHNIQSTSPPPRAPRMACWLKLFVAQTCVGRLVEAIDSKECVF